MAIDWTVFAFFLCLRSGAGCVADLSGAIQRAGVFTSALTQIGSWRNPRERFMASLRAAFTLLAEVEAVFRAFGACEFSTLPKDGTPITWPTLPFWDAEQQCFVVIKREAQANLRARGERP